MVLKCAGQKVAASIASVILLLSSHHVVAQTAAVDSTGARITLTQAAKRIVTLSPHATELVVAAGALDAIVAVSEYSDTPDQVKSLPVVGNASALDYERIVALRPDLIVAPSYVQSAQRALLKNYPLFIVDAKTPEAIADEIVALGALTGHETIAAQEASRLRLRLNALRAQRGGKHVRVFYLVWNEPIYTVGGASLINQAIRFCGATNIFSEMPAAFPVVSREAVIQAAPELMILGASEKNFEVWRQDWLRWTQIPATEKQSIVRVDPDLLHRPGPRFIDGMETLCRTIAQAKAQKF